MHSVRAMIFLLLGLGVSVAGAAEVTNKWSFEGSGDVSYAERTGIYSATNGFTFVYGDVKLIAEQETVNIKTGDVVTEGHVRVERGGQVWQGERIEYNFINGKLASESFRTGQNPFFVQVTSLPANRKPVSTSGSTQS